MQISHTKVPKPAAAPAPYGGVLKLALPASPLYATFSSVVALKVGRPVRALVPRRLIALFAANSNEHQPSLRRPKHALQVLGHLAMKRVCLQRLIANIIPLLSPLFPFVLSEMWLYPL